MFVPVLGAVGPGDEGAAEPLGADPTGVEGDPADGAPAGTGGRFGGVAVTGRGPGWGWPGTGFGSFGKADATGVPTAPTAVDAATTVISALVSALLIRAFGFRWRAIGATSFLSREGPRRLQSPPIAPHRPPACRYFITHASII